MHNNNDDDHYKETVKPTTTSGGFADAILVVGVAGPGQGKAGRKGLGLTKPRLNVKGSHGPREASGMPP